MNVENKLKELGIVIPDISKPLAAYVPGIKTGEFVYISGQLPLKDGVIMYTGKLGKDVTVAEGQAAARLAAINCLAVLKNCIGNWDSLVQIVKVTGYVQSELDFYEQPAVINGASELLQEVFGEQGKHARAAVGVSSLPLNAACEVEMIARVK